ncbi:MAG: ABC transporter permease [Anaerolineae bacterium]|nr:ABC transporter permease [Anaerolineae bacterium]
MYRPDAQQPQDPAEQSNAKPLYVIDSQNRWLQFNFKELWDYRNLLVMFTWRTLSVRYKQTVLGAFWIIIQPVITMIVFTIFFGQIAKLPSDGIPYPIFNFTALVPWGLFAGGMASVSGSILGNAQMMKRIYFPRLVIPLSTLLSNLVDVVLSFGVLLVMIAFFTLGMGDSLLNSLGQETSTSFGPTWNVIWLPFLLLQAFVASLGIGLLLGALNAQFRDVRQMLGFIGRGWMLITPIIYPTSMLDEPLRTLSLVNPMTPVVNGFRWALLGADTGPEPIWILSALVAAGMLLLGMLYFRRVENTLIDIM